MTKGDLNEILGRISIERLDDKIPIVIEPLDGREMVMISIEHRTDPVLGARLVLKAGGPREVLSAA